MLNRTAFIKWLYQSMLWLQDLETENLILHNVSAKIYSNIHVWGEVYQTLQYMMNYGIPLSVNIDT